MKSQDQITNVLDGIVHPDFELEPREPECPPVPALLLEWLDRQFPQRCPLLSDAERIVWFKAGHRAVVDYLQAAYDHQNGQE